MSEESNTIVCTISEWEDHERFWKRTIRVGIFKISFELKYNGHWENEGDEEIYVYDGFWFYQSENDDDGGFPKTEYFEVESFYEAVKLADAYILEAVEKVNNTLKGVVGD